MDQLHTVGQFDRDAHVGGGFGTAVFHANFDRGFRPDFDRIVPVVDHHDQGGTAFDVGGHFDFLVAAFIRSHADGVLVFADGLCQQLDAQVDRLSGVQVPDVPGHTFARRIRLCRRCWL